MLPISLRPALLLPFAALLLSACGSDGNSAGSQTQAPVAAVDDSLLNDPLLAITTRDKDGNITAVTHFDYDGQTLRRIRNYSGAGLDALWNTSDDVLASYVDCQIEASGPALFDPFNEAAGSYSLPDSCALPQFSGKANAITSIHVNNAGPDAVWMTADDVVAQARKLTRSADGSVLENAPSQFHSSDGLGPGPITPIETVILHNTYTPDGQGRITKISRIEASFYYNSRGEVTGTNSSFLLPISAGITFQALSYRQYDKLDSSRTLDSYYMLLLRDKVEALAATPTGYLILSTNYGYPGALSELEGRTYMRLDDQRRLIATNKRHIESITLLKSAGPDHVWGSSDDGKDSRLDFTYLALTP